MIRTPAVTILFACVSFSQPTPPPPAFEVASIKLALPPTRGRESVRTSVSVGGLNYTNVSLSDLIGKAYGLQRPQISGPAWLDTERFDIVARIPAGVHRDQVPRMLQTLLADRFHLQSHIEEKQLPIYVLVAAKNGPKLQKAKSASGLGGALGNLRAHANGAVSMSQLADYLSLRLGRPVRDQTTLEGAYVIVLDWTPDPTTSQPDAPPGPSIFTALQEQLGLRLAPEKGPVEVLVIDHVERVPTEN
jgi:uncharacterized protein (TIGR03435 family)